MAITRISVGSFTSGLGAITPVAGTFAAGDMLAYITGEFIGSNTIATPAGWSPIDANTNAQQTRVFARIATGSDTIPSVNWSASNRSWAVILAYRGVDSGLSNTGAPSDRQYNTTQNIIGPASSLTPSADNSLVLLIGQRNKSSTTDATTYSAPASFSVAAQYVGSGNSQNSVAICEWIQTTATNIGANLNITGSVAETVTQTGQGMRITLAAASTSTGAQTSLALLGVGG